MNDAILKRLFEAKKARVAQEKSRVDAEDFKSRTLEKVKDREHGRFLKALQNDGINIIAEFKRASPSKGNIGVNADPTTVAKQYEAGGAAAMSVLTEQDFFTGSLDDLRAVRSATSLPILRKDFIFDEFQIVEAADAGADAILLIASMLDAAHIRALSETAEVFGLDALVEVHTRDEMKSAAAFGARLIGVNNRDLQTFEVSLDTSRKLIAYAPEDAVLVTESGLEKFANLDELYSLGYRGFLIGETLMKSADAATQLHGLKGAVR